MNSKKKQRLKQIFSNSFRVQFHESINVDYISFNNIDTRDLFGHVELITLNQRLTLIYQ